MQRVFAIEKIFWVSNAFLHLSKFLPFSRVIFVVLLRFCEPNPCPPSTSEHAILVWMQIQMIQSKLFRYGMWWRIFYGFLRVVLGLVLSKQIDVSFHELLYKVMSYELTEDPSDILFQSVSTFLQVHPFTVTHFLALYLIFWGCVDVVLSAFLLRHKLWAFPLSLTLIAFFILYEFYRLLHVFSWALLSVIVLDMVIFWLINREYKNMTLKTREEEVSSSI